MALSAEVMGLCSGGVRVRVLSRCDCCTILTLLLSITALRAQSFLRVRAGHHPVVAAGEDHVRHVHHGPSPRPPQHAPGTALRLYP